MRVFAFAAALAIAALWPAPTLSTPSAPDGPARIELARITDPPPMDGTLQHPAWKQAQRVRLGYDLRSRGTARQETTAYIATDGHFVYVGFAAAQHEPIRATQHTNDVGQNADDQVAVYFWPDGANGFEYAFVANPIGTHYQFSSENTSYAPTWSSAGHITPEGYTVTMRIPLEVMRGASARAWRVQFARSVADTRDDYIWQHGEAQQVGQDDNVLYAGLLDGLPQAAAVRPKPRIGIYALGAITSPASGGATSRLGADLAIPITPSASFVSTIHPDYSNVELDQQTIAPNAYAHQYREVRPFFTQGSAFYNPFDCNGCPGIQELYTPAIPTPRVGYALEGKQGPFGFAAFEAVGAGRVDTAQAIAFHDPSQRDTIAVERISTDAAGLKDDTTVLGAAHDSLHGLFEYVTYGNERGTTVQDPSRALRREVGVGTYSSTANLNLALRSVGSSYSPVDGYVAHPGIAGYDVSASKTWYYRPTSRFPRLIVFGEVDRYHGTDGSLDQADTTLALGFDTKTLWHYRLQTGSSYLRLGSGTFTPVTQNGIAIDYHLKTSTPSTISYATGRFGPGRLAAWRRSVTLPAGSRATLAFEADDDVQRLDSGPRNIVWLERANYIRQSGANASLALGVRRVIGTSPLLGFGQAAAIDAWNLSAAYHRRLGRNELYLVYGDASAFSTAPQATIKLIHYVGAEKGT